MTALALSLFVVGFAFAVDPYDYWNAPKFAGFNLIKPFVGKHINDVKSRQYLRVLPRTLVAGNSRVEVGFDTESPAWPESFRPVYNLGLPGKPFTQLVQIAIHLMARQKPQQLILGLDFFDFRVPAREWRGFDGKLPPPKDFPPGELRLQTVEQTLFSRDALADSVLAVAWQWRRFPPNTTPGGYYGWNDFEYAIADKGVGVIFAAGDQARFTTLLRPEKSRWQMPGGNNNDLALKKIIDYCDRSGIKLTLFIYPYHSDLLEGIYLTGRWKDFEDWKRRLVEIANRAGLGLWDFSQYNEITTEPIPQMNDLSARLRWFLDSGHFNSKVGDRLISLMSGRDQSGSRLGTKIDGGNIDLHLAKIRDQRQRYLVDRPADAERISKLVAAARRGFGH